MQGGSQTTLWNFPPVSDVGADFLKRHLVRVKGDVVFEHGRTFERTIVGPRDLLAVEREI